MINFGTENKEIKTPPFLVKTIEEVDNDITFIVSLPIEGKKGTNIDDIEPSKLTKLLAKCIPVYPDKNNLYKIVFKNYVLHQTRNESYTSYDNYEIRKGRFFLIFEKSRLLDYVSQLINIELVDNRYPNGYKHYGIYCENQIIDIIATEEPIITRFV